MAWGLEEAGNSNNVKQHESYIDLLTSEEGSSKPTAGGQYGKHRRNVEWTADLLEVRATDAETSNSEQQRRLTVTGKGTADRLSRPYC
jgi:hypothetical protein